MSISNDRAQQKIDDRISQQTYKYGVFFFQILYSASIKRSFRTSDTSAVLAVAAEAAVPVIVQVLLISLIIISSR